jgi:predicted transcriptional regulator
VESQEWLIVLFLVIITRYYQVIIEGVKMATSIKLDNEMRSRIQHLADLRDRSAHWIMCEAIKHYVEKEESKESFKQEALDSWNSYRETGQHLTGQEVCDWLDTWGTDKEKEIPLCHE